MELGRLIDTLYAFKDSPEIGRLKDSIQKYDRINLSRMFLSQKQREKYVNFMKS